MQKKVKKWRIIDLIEWTTDYFKKNEILSPRLDAELLLGHVIEKSRLQLYLNFEKVVPKEQLAEYRELVKKRSQRVPVNYLINNKEFRSLDFYVDENVLIPRPETEVLVETILEDKTEDRKFLDIGTGSGAIAISVAKERPNWEIFATDISTEVIQIAKRNAQNHDLEERISFLQGNLFEPIDSNMHFDWIVSNPPYIKSDELAKLMPEVRDYEPKIALDGGKDGLKLIRTIIEEAPLFLAKGGRIAIEIGFEQGDAVKNIIQENPAYTECDIIKDYSGKERVVIAYHKN